MSLMMRSKSASEAIRKDEERSGAVSTSCPCRFKMVDRNFRVSSLSSTNRIRTPHAAGARDSFAGIACRLVCDVMILAPTGHEAAGRHPIHETRRAKSGEMFPSAESEHRHS